MANWKEIKQKPKQYILPNEVQEEKKKRNDLYHDLNMAKKAKKEHERTHIKEKPYSCTKCEKRFDNAYL